MSTFPLRDLACRNRLLSLLGDDDLVTLAPVFELVDLKQEEVLRERDRPLSHVYFPCSCVLSVLGRTRSGQAVEIGTIGNEGFLGIELLTGRQRVKAGKAVTCPIPGKAFRLPAAGFVKIVDRYSSLETVVWHYVPFYLSLMRQSMICSRLHPLQARFAYWLLLSHDRVGQDSFRLTPETLANALDARQAAVTSILDNFERAGAIRCSGGLVTVLDRQIAEDSACECYGSVQKKFEKLIGPFGNKFGNDAALLSANREPGGSVQWSDNDESC